MRGQTIPGVAVAEKNELDVTLPVPVTNGEEAAELEGVCDEVWEGGENSAASQRKNPGILSRIGVASAMEGVLRMPLAG